MVGMRRVQIVKNGTVDKDGIVVNDGTVVKYNIQMLLTVEDDISSQRWYQLLKMVMIKMVLIVKSGRS